MRKIFLITISFFVIFLSSVQAGRFSLELENTNVRLNCENRIDIFVDPQGIDSNAADIEINYDPSDIQIIDENPSASGTQIGTGGAYSHYFNNLVNSSTGKIYLAGTSFSSVVSANSLFGYFRFTPLSSGSASLQIIYTSGSTHDSNIARYTNSTDTLTSVQNLTFNVSTQSCGPDTTGPLIIFRNPPENGELSTDTSPIIIEVQDTLSDVDITTLEIIINGVTYTEQSPEITYVLQDGKYIITFTPSAPYSEEVNIQVIVADSVGNSSQSTTVFTIQEDEPVPPPPPPPSEEPGEEEPARNPIAEIITDIAEDTVDFVIDNSNPIAQAVSLVVLVALAPTAISLLAQIGSLQALLAFIAAVLGLNRHKPWGLIYNIISLDPVSFAVLELYDEDGNLVAQSVSDVKGRYSFAASKGSYILKVKHSDYVDREINVELRDDKIINLDIPMAEKEHNLSFKGRLLSLKREFEEFMKKIRPTVLVLGFLLSLYLVLTSPNIVNTLIFTSYLVIDGYNLIKYVAFAANISRLKDSASSKAITSRAMVKLFDRKTWQLVDTQITTKDGKFGFGIEPGEYALLVSAKGYNFPSKNVPKNSLVEDKLQSLLKVDVDQTKPLKGTIELDPKSGRDTKSTGLENPFA